MSKQDMSLDPLPSPHMRLQSASTQSSPFKMSSAREFGDCSVLFERHRFLLTMLAILAVVCTIYLYYAVNLGQQNHAPVFQAP